MSERPLLGESGPCFRAGRPLYEKRDWVISPKCIGAARHPTGHLDNSSSSLANLVGPCRHCSFRRSYSPGWRRRSRTGGADHPGVHRAALAIEWRRALWTVAQALSYRHLASATSNARAWRRRTSPPRPRKCVGSSRLAPAPLATGTLIGRSANVR